MTKLIISALLLLTFGTAFADEGGGPPTPSASTSITSTISPSMSSSATQTSTANNSGVSGNNNTTFTSPGEITQSINYSGTQTIKNTPSVNGPPLTTSNDTCMGSTSGSINVAGFGFGGGSTWTDKNCTRLKNSRELWNMGMKAASLALMCNDPENMTALELTGFVCPQTAKKNEKKSNVVVTPLQN